MDTKELSLLNELRKTLDRVGNEYAKQGKTLDKQEACLDISCFLCECFDMNNVPIEFVLNLWFAGMKIIAEEEKMSSVN